MRHQVGQSQNWWIQHYKSYIPEDLQRQNITWSNEMARAAGRQDVSHFWSFLDTSISIVINVMSQIPPSSHGWLITQSDFNKKYIPTSWLLIEHVTELSLQEWHKANRMSSLYSCKPENKSCCIENPSGVTIQHNSIHFSLRPISPLAQGKLASTSYVLFTSQTRR